MDDHPIPAPTPKSQEPPPSAANSTLDAGGIIATPPNVLTGVVLPVILLVAVLLVVLSPDTSRMVDPCNNYLTVQLVYPLIFGALGATIGGNIRLNGQLPLFGNVWNGVVAGGIGAALLGFAITASIKPNSCAPKDELVLQKFVVRKQFDAADRDKPVTRDYFGKIDWSDKVNVVVVRSADFSRDLKMLFSGDDEFQINMEFDRNVEGASYYQSAAKCALEVKIGYPRPRSDELQFKLVKDNNHSQIQLNPKLFDQIEDQLKANPANRSADCIFGDGQLGGENGKAIEFRPIKTLYVVNPSLNPLSSPEFWFVTPAPKEQDTKTSAREPELSQKDTPAPTTTASVRTTELAQPTAKRVVAGCEPPNDAQQSDIDAYLDGDDLDQSHRSALYASWPTLHCYVWSFFAGSGAATNSVQRARSLHLLVSAILNTPATADQIASYWQPQGENRRDFTKPLPYLSAADYRTIFDQIKSDDIALSGEAMRTIRYLPVDSFERIFRQQLGTIGALKPAEQERLSVAASFMYYNRIVEWLDDDPNAKPSTSIINAEYNAAKHWISANYLGKSVNSYDAMLLYARGIVERERQLVPDLGKNTFSIMTKTIEGLQDSYPSNVRHIGQALAISRGGSDAQAILGLIKEVDVYPSSTSMTFDPPPPSQIAIFAGPGDRFPKLTIPLSATAANNAYLLEQKGDWYLANAPGWVGWIYRPPKPS